MSSQGAGRQTTIAAIAILTVVANLVLSVNWPLALVAGGAVLLFGEVVSRPFGRRGSGLAIPVANPETVPSQSYPLTRKEVEVGVLVAQGNSNKAIATKLFNSERTIDNHVQHIYNKLNIDSRAELALWMREHGLLPDSSARK
jgi:DNA-binding CsgD family transcriptional regulator